jgi:tetratricopeptide (TPR) repeat protein
MKIRHLLLATLTVLSFALPGYSLAGQDDPRLDGLFERLHATDSEDEAQILQSFIWSIWVEANDDELNRLMYEGTRAMQVGDLDLAAKMFSDVIKIAPEFAEGWNKRATVYYLIGEYDKSIADCMAVLDLEPRHFGALSGLGLIYTSKQDDENALHWFNEALAQNPHMPSIRQQAEELEEKLNGQAI